MRALVVDDSRAMRGILRRILSDIGFDEIAEAVDGRDGLAKHACPFHEQRRLRPAQPATLRPFRSGHTSSLSPRSDGRSIACGSRLDAVTREVGCGRLAGAE